MELSRVSDYLSNNPEEYNLLVNEKLVSPDQLFNSSEKSKEINTTLTLFPEEKPKLINKQSVVLHIGDSHTAGIYGKEMDSLFRKTGAKITTVGSSGSSPSWWINEATTKAQFCVGSAITAKANAQDEYQECLLKANALFKVLS